MEGNADTQCELQSLWAFTSGYREGPRVDAAGAALKDTHTQNQYRVCICCVALNFLEGRVLL